MFPARWTPRTKPATMMRASSGTRPEIHDSAPFRVGRASREAPDAAARARLSSAGSGLPAGRPGSNHRHEPTGYAYPHMPRHAGDRIMHPALITYGSLGIAI